jgi:hypothetical protein
MLMRSWLNVKRARSSRFKNTPYPARKPPTTDSVCSSHDPTGLQTARPNYCGVVGAAVTPRRTVKAESKASAEKLESRRRGAAKLPVETFAFFFALSGHLFDSNLVMSQSQRHKPAMAITCVIPVIILLVLQINSVHHHQGIPS